MQAFRRLVVALLIVSSLAVGSSAAMKLHLMLDRETVTQVLWSGEGEVLVLVGTQKLGWSGSALAYLLNYVKAWLWLATELETLDESVLLFRWNGEAFEQQVLADTPMGLYLVSNRRVYGRLRAGFSQWTGASFEPISHEEAGVVSAGFRAFSDLSLARDGWVTRQSILAIGPGVSHDIVVSGGGVELTIAAATSADGKAKSLDVTIGGQRERLWQNDETWRFVDEATYTSASQ